MNPNYCACDGTCDWGDTFCDNPIECPGDCTTCSDNLCPETCGFVSCCVQDPSTCTAECRPVPGGTEGCENHSEGAYLCPADPSDCVYTYKDGDCVDKPFTCCYENGCTTGEVCISCIGGGGGQACDLESSWYPCDGSEVACYNAASEVDEGNQPICCELCESTRGCCWI